MRSKLTSRYVMAVLVAGFLVAGICLRMVASDTDGVRPAPLSANFGPVGAPTRITALVDPDGTTCPRELQALGELADQNPGEVRVEVRYVPVHAGDLDLAATAYALHMQGQGLAAMDRYRRDSVDLVRTERPPASASLSSAASTVNSVQLALDASDPTLRAGIDANAQIAKRLRVDRYPFLVINGMTVNDCDLTPLRSLVRKRVATETRSRERESR